MIRRSKSTVKLRHAMYSPLIGWRGLRLLCCTPLYFSNFGLSLAAR